ASGEVVLVWHADDCAAPIWVEPLVRAAEDDAFLGGSLDLLKLNTARQRSWYGGDMSLPGVRAWDGFLPWVTSANFALRADLAHELGPFDAHYIGPGRDIAVSWRGAPL